MIIGRTEGNLVVIGLSVENLIRLSNGQPIQLQLSDYGLPPQDILIMADTDERKMLAQFKGAGLISSQTKKLDGGDDPQKKPS